MKTKVYKSNWWRVKQLILMSAFLLMATAGYAQEELTIKMEGDPDVAPGEFITYVITYSNIGDKIARDVNITLQLPATTGYYTFIEANPDGLYNSSNHTITWNKNFIPNLENMGAGPYVIQVRIRAGVQGNVYGYSPLGYYMPNDGPTTFNSTVSIRSNYTTVPLTRSVATRVDQISATEVTDVNGIIKSATGSLTYHLVKVENKGNIYDRFNLFIDPDNLKGYDCYPNVDDKDFQELDGSIYDLNNNLVTISEWLAPRQSKYYFVRKESPIGTNPSSGSGDKWNCMDIVARSVVSGKQDDGMTQTLIVGNENNPLIAMTKIASPDPVERGGVVTYTIYVFNSNDKTSAIAEGTVLTDLLPEGATYIEGSSTYKTGLQAPVPITPTIDNSGPRPEASWNLGSIGYGPTQAKTITFQVRVDEDGDCIDNLVNDASLTYIGQVEPVTASITTSIVSHPDLVITKESTIAEAEPGDQITYTLTYSNEGTCPVDNVYIIDTFDTEKLAYIGNTGGGDFSDNVITFSGIGTLYPGQEGSIEVTLAVKSLAFFPDGGTYLLNNIATIDGDDMGTTEIDEFNNTSSWAVAVKILPDLKIEKSVSPALAPGEESTYTLTVTNTGDKPAVNAVVKDFLPAGLTVDESTISDGGTLTSGTITWPTIASFAVGQTATYTVNVTPTCSALGTITNTAEVWSDTPDKNELNNEVELISTVEDNTPPVVVADGSSTVNCLAEAVAPTVPDAADNCDGVISGVLEGFVDTPDPLTCEGTRVYTYSYTDGADNVAYWTYTYTIESIPFAAIPSTAATVDCYDNIVMPTLPTVTDNCGIEITDITGPVEGMVLACEGDVTYTWTYTDCAGSTQDYVHTVTIDIPELAVIPATSETVDCYADFDASSHSLPTVLDACGNTLTPTGPVEGTVPACEGDVTYTWTYTDCAGSTQDYVHTVTIEREDFTLPPNGTSTVACVDDVVAPTPPAVNDACGNPITPVAGAAPVPPACNGEMIYTWTYTDCEGNSHDWTHTITISAPVVVMPPNGVEVVTDPSATVEPAHPDVFDNCGRQLTVSAGVATDDIACFGAKIWTYTYTDCSGKTYKWTYTYSIGVPTVTMPPNESSTVDCTVDATEPTPPVVYDSNSFLLDVSAGVRSSDPACVGDITWTYTYEDCVGNAYLWVYTYTIDIPDFAANMPANGGSTVDCLVDAQVQPTPPAVNDFCGNPITPTLVTTPADIACDGDMVWVFNYEDCEGNSHDWSYTYTIDIPDFTANIPVDGASTVECIADATEPVPPVVADACSGSTTVSLVGFVDAPDPITNNGTRTYTFRYVDCANNEAMWNYVYTIDDTQDPTITCPATVSVPADPGVCYALASNVDLGMPVTDDNCGVASVTNDAPAQFPTGDTQVTWTVTDVAGNTATCMQTVTVFDDEDPIINCAVTEEQVVEANASCIYAVSGTGWDATATDNCGVTSLTYALTGATTDSGGTSLDGVEFSLGSTTVTWTAINGTGNEIMCSFTVVVNDVSAPTFTCNDFTVTLDENNQYTISPEDLALIATDIQGGCTEEATDITVSVDMDEFTCETLGAQTVTVTVTDASGNSSTCQTTITVVDPVDPTITCAGDVEASVQSDESCLGFVTVPAPTVGDNCGIASITNDFNGSDDASGDYPVGETVVTWTVTDNDGNTATCQQRVVLISGPLALDDEASLMENEDVQIYVLDNDEDCDDNLDNTSLTITSQPAEGTATVNADGSITYKPNITWYGTDQLIYQICDADGQCDEATVSITVTPNDDLLIPNGFSPNGDGINDYFRVRGIHRYPNAHLEVYNRWGAKVYTRDRYGDIQTYGNPGAWWDGRPNVKGTSNSEILPEGTYFIILLLDGSNMHKGTLYINR